MKKLVVVIVMVCMFVLSCFAQEAESPPDSWFYVGYSHGGITFPVPEDTLFCELTAQEQAMGIVLICYNEDFMLQLRRFAPQDMTWKELRDSAFNEVTAEVSYLDENKSILHYKNTKPTAYSELVGIALNDLDGNMYKISIFAGVDEDYSTEANVWEIAETVAAYTSQMDFSEWPLQDTLTSEYD